jgi:hypothetical protein
MDPSEQPADASPPPGRLRRFLSSHGRKLWWLHSLYALGLGASVVVFSRRGFAYSRWLVAFLGAAWLILGLVFRWYAGGEPRQAGTRVRLRFFVMTYVLKNLYQAMLFFLLPFYWRSTTLDAPNRWFLVLLGVCALVSTLDVVFDQAVMRFRWLASLFYGVTLFSCLNLVVPALFPATQTLHATLVAAVAAAIALWSLHVTRRLLTIPGAAVLAGVGLLVLCAGSAVAVSRLRAAIPPVPLHVAHGAVGPRVLPDGRLELEVTKLHRAQLVQMVAVTDVDAQAGLGDRLRHVWRHRGAEVPIARAAEVEPGPARTLRLRSRLAAAEVPADPTGRWSVDVETEGGQLVGRVRFEVFE